MSLNYENVGKNVIYNRSVDNIEDYVKGTIVGCYIGEDEEYYVTSIESSGECIRITDDSLIEIIEGDSITPQGIVDATSQMTDEQAADTLDNIGGEPEKLIVEISENSAVWTANYSYQQMIDAIENGKSVMLSDSSSLYHLVSDDPDWLVFAELRPNGVNLNVRCFTTDDTDIWELYDVNISPAPTIVTDTSSTSITLEASANTEYHYGTLTALTISSFPAQGKFWIWFTSGATATTTTGIANFVAEANKLYRIFVEDGYATYDSWATS